MRCIKGLLAILACCVCATALPAHAADTVQLSPQAAALTDEQVVASMKKAIAYLLSVKRGDNWEIDGVDHNNHDDGGETALVLYSMLHAGQSLEDDPISDDLSFHSANLAPVITYLSKIEPIATYTTSLQANALTLFLRTPETTKILKDDHDYLLKAFGSYGGYTYNPTGDPVHPSPFAIQGEMDDLRAMFNQARNSGDEGSQNALNQQYLALQAQLAPAKLALAQQTSFNNANLSTSQYGTLGAWALADEGIEFPMGYWYTTDGFWRHCQQPDGSWDYFPEGRGNGAPNDMQSMTTAGLASLYVAAEFIDRELRLVNKEDKAIDNGLKKVSADFDPALHNYYYMYGIERVGLASGYKFFGTKDWYREGAANIIKSQEGNGAYATGEFTGTTPAIATAYGLLFLARGRNPVVFNKLEYDGNTWDARPRDDANITHWMSKKFERPINWQIVSLGSDAQDWTDAPVLLITGSRPLNFKPDEIAKLRAFINAGGTIFSSADGNSSEFTESVRKMAGKVSENQYEMRALPPDHVLFSQTLWAKINNPPKMLGMSNGIRELWIHSPADMGASWQLHKYASKEHFELPANLYFYASGKATLHSKLRSLAVPAAANAPARTITIGRLQYPGNWDPEPGAWPRFAKIAAATFNTGLTVNPVAAAALNPAQQQLVHLTGSTAFVIPAADMIPLKAYIAGGGMLFVDAGGGNTNFTNSFTKICKNLSTGELVPIPANDPLFTNVGPDGVNIQNIDLRKYAITVVGRGNQPQLMGVQQNGRWVIIFSPYDISSGFLDTNTWGILGYTSQSSQDLARNIVLYAAKK